MTNQPPNLEPAHILIEHHRFKEAEEALRREIAANPGDSRAYSYLALALEGQGRGVEGLEAAREAVGMAPDNDFAHYVTAVILGNLDQLAEALAAIREAIRLNPASPTYYLRLAGLLVDKGEWKAALYAAEIGRALDPEDPDLANMQAVALTRLGRRDEAGQAIAGALAKDPDNPLTHANQGWVLLHEGDHKAAMESFRESLRLNPMNEWARSGIIESLRARNPVYRVLLKYFLWMGNLNPQVRWGVVLGGYVLYRGLSTFSRSNPQYSAWIAPVLVVYLLFTLLTWVARPLADLLVRLDKFGRLALTRDQTVASNWVGAFLILAGLFAVGGFVLQGFLLLLAAVYCLAMILPVSGVYSARPGKGRLFLGLYTLALGLVGIAALVNLVLMNPDLGLTLASYFLYGWVAFTWIANFVR